MYTIKFISFFVLFTTSCVVAATPDELNKDPNTRDEITNIGSPVVNGGRSVCDGHNSAVVTTLPNGKTITVELPVFCNPNYLDTGDPVPEQEFNHDYDNSELSTIMTEEMK